MRGRPQRRKKKTFIKRRKVCRFCADKIQNGEKLTDTQNTKCGRHWIL